MQAWQYENLLPEEVKKRGREGSDGKIIKRKGREITAKRTVSSKIIEKRREGIMLFIKDLTRMNKSPCH